MIHSIITSHHDPAKGFKGLPTGNYVFVSLCLKSYIQEIQNHRYTKWIQQTTFMKHETTLHFIPQSADNSQSHVGTTRTMAIQAFLKVLKHVTFSEDTFIYELVKDWLLKIVKNNVDISSVMFLFCFEW